ncbi:MAG: ornithine carbamoyltransferase [Actinobacteria bacterium]|uniref:ornithine carbamoyltransferase n=1 Tax=freshwater metagenome TaxID=449393 RepID=A0A6J5Z6K5_9ZZZZ|nr:ornithine carbamoyltransferase [Actinomycetota bacterium]
MDLKDRDFLKEVDFTAGEFRYLIDLAVELKAAKKARSEEQRMVGRNIALIFEKTSTRTRCAFEVAAFDQGAHTTYLDGASSQVGHKESVADTARVLSRYYDAIEYRGKSQDLVEELAEYSDVPVYNGLTDMWHPTQMLADFMTMMEHSGKKPDDITFAYVGDARSNMGNSLLVTAAMLGTNIRIAAPSALWPAKSIQELAAALAQSSGAQILLTQDMEEALPNADFVHTDVWVSMGESEEIWKERVELLGDYQVNDAALAKTGNPNAKFMHCLPGFHNEQTTVGRAIAKRTGMHDGLEVTHDVFEGPKSVVFDQAENRLHTIKAIMVATIGE